MGAVRHAFEHAVALVVVAHELARAVERADVLAQLALREADEVRDQIDGGEVLQVAHVVDERVVGAVAAYAH